MRAIRDRQDAKDVDLGKILEFMRVLWAMDHGLQSLSKRMRSALGVTGPQRLALRIIGRLPNTRAGQVAEILEIHPSTLTGILQRLEDGGLIERRGDPADRRRALLRLTARGRRVDALRAGTVESAVTRALRGFPSGKIAVTRDVLVAISRALEAEPT